MVALVDALKLYASLAACVIGPALLVISVQVIGHRVWGRTGLAIAASATAVLTVLMLIAYYAETTIPMSGGLAFVVNLIVLGIWLSAFESVLAFVWATRNRKIEKSTAKAA